MQSQLEVGTLHLTPKLAIHWTTFTEVITASKFTDTQQPYFFIGREGWTSGSDMQL